MSSAEIVAVLVAATALVTALVRLTAQMRRLELRVDGRLSELLELTRKASKAEGVLEATSTPSPPLPGPTRTTD